MPAKGESPEQAEDNQDSEQTALIPSSLCPGMDVGDEVVLKIVGVHEDEYEVAYDPKKAKGDNAKEPSMAGASEDNESAMQGGGSGYYD